MTSIATVALSSIQNGQAYPPYDGSSTTFSSGPFKGNGYYGYTDGLHTVTYAVTNFIGVLKFQATLVTSPTENDWFDVTSTSIGDGSNAISGNYFFNFTGNFVWCRAHITNFSAGQINRVLYNT